MRQRVGIIGNGVVGAAHANVFSHYADVKVYDSDPLRKSHSWKDTIQQDVLFVCLPTPMRKDGSVDRSIVERVLEDIRIGSSAKAVILKSTLPPADLRDLDAKMGEPGPALIFSPEFLTERSAEYDLQQSTRFIFGCESIQPEAAQLVDDLFNRRFPLVPCYWTSLECASLVKYFTNVFFATKVALMNEFSRIAESFEPTSSSHDVLELMMLDPRIGRSHFQVPGHDGREGFGGSCFLKDLNGYDLIAEAQGESSCIARAAWHSNMQVRGAANVAQELNRLIGRAISERIEVDELEALML